MKLNDLVKKIKPAEVQPLPDYLLTDTIIVGYPDKEMQNQIYDYALKGLEYEDLSGNILDVGCGRGDLYSYMSNITEFGWPTFTYMGVEKNVPLVMAGKQIRGEYSDFNIFEGDFFDIDFPQCKTAFVIGTLNNLGWVEFKKMFDKLYALSNKIIFIVNSEDEPENELVGFGIGEMVEKLNLTSNIRFNIDHSFMPGIFKLTIYK